MRDEEVRGELGLKEAKGGVPLYKGKSRAPRAGFMNELLEKITKENFMPRKKFHNLTWTQRLQIEAFLKVKLPVKKIAELIGVHQSTVYREIRRGRYVHRKKRYDFYGDPIGYHETERYSPDIAQQNAELNASSKGAPLKIGKDFAFAEYIEKQIIDEGMSPDAVIGHIRRNHLPFETSICRNTLYSYIEKGVFARLSLQHLKEKGQKKKRKKRTLQAAKPPRGTSIEQRPSEIWSRNTFGHWEMDCVCGPTREVLLVLTERQTRREIIMKMPDQCAASVVQCLNVLERKYGKLFRKIFRSITVDNGSEFSDYAGMERSVFGRGRAKRTTVYYCHPYRSCERGSNERMNREIRRKIPKGSDIGKFSDEDVRQVEAWLNGYPRRILGYASSEELFQERLAELA